MGFFSRVTRAITAAHLLPIAASVVAGAVAYRYITNNTSGNRQARMESSTSHSQTAYGPRSDAPQSPRHEPVNPSPPSHIPQNANGSTPGGTRVTITPRDTTEIYGTRNRGVASDSASEQSSDGTARGAGTTRASGTVR